jgi:hypothetical protein
MKQFLLRTFAHTKYVGQNVFTGGEITALDTLIERCRNGSGAICNGNGTSWPFEYFGKYIWKSTQDIFGELKVLR